MAALCSCDDNNNQQYKRRHILNAISAPEKRVNGVYLRFPSGTPLVMTSLEMNQASGNECSLTHTVR